MNRVLDMLFGKKCTCGQRVYPKDKMLHLATQHGWPQ